MIKPLKPIKPTNTTGPISPTAVFNFLYNKILEFIDSELLIDLDF